MINRPKGRPTVLVAMCWACVTAVAGGALPGSFLADQQTEPSARGLVSECEGTQFKDELGGSGIMTNGRRFSFHLYKSFDGIAVSTRVEHYRSTARARRELKRKVNKAQRVVERGYKIDKNGVRVGSRVAAIFAARTGVEAQATVFWTSGSDLHYIESTSLACVLSFEKTFYP